MTDLIQLAVLSAIALSCGLIGPFLVLKRMTMFANSLSHTILLGIAAAFLVTGGQMFDLSNLLLGAMAAALMTALFTEGLVRVFRLQEDASIGLVFTFLFALGILVVTYFMRDVHLGLEAIMGNADVLQWQDFKLAAGLVLFNCAVVGVLYRPLQQACFDGRSSRGIHYLLLFLTAAVSVASFRAVGVLLVLGLLTGPFLIARMFFHRLPHILIASPLIGIGVSAFGVLLCRVSLDVLDLPLSTGGMIALLLGLSYIFSQRYHARLRFG